MRISKTFTFDAAHQLPHVPEGHQCGRLHGHTYQVDIVVDGPMDEKQGWVMDFADIKAVFKPLEKQMDHHLLNDIPGLENPTAENMAIWIWERMFEKVPLLYCVKVKETPTSLVEYFGESPERENEN